MNYADMQKSCLKPVKLLDQVRTAVRVRHYSLKTTMIYTHVLNNGALAVKSPAGRL